MDVLQIFPAGREVKDPGGQNIPVRVRPWKGKKIHFWLHSGYPDGFYAFLKYPTIFEKCAILSTAFWIYEEEFVKLLKVSSISHNMLYMDVGGQEEDERYIPSNLHLKECIEEKIDHFQYHFFPEGRHSEYDWSQRVPLFLKMFYKGE